MANAYQFATPITEEEYKKYNNGARLQPYRSDYNSQKQSNNIGKTFATPISKQEYDKTMTNAKRAVSSNINIDMPKDTLFTNNGTKAANLPANKPVATKQVPKPVAKPTPGILDRIIGAIQASSNSNNGPIREETNPAIVRAQIQNPYERSLGGGLVEGLGDIIAGKGIIGKKANEFGKDNITKRIGNINNINPSIKPKTSTSIHAPGIGNVTVGDVANNPTIGEDISNALLKGGVSLADRGEQIGNVGKKSFATSALNLTGKFAPMIAEGMITGQIAKSIGTPGANALAMGTNVVERASATAVDTFRQIKKGNPNISDDDAAQAAVRSMGIDIPVLALTETAAPFGKLFSKAPAGIKGALLKAVVNAANEGLVRVPTSAIASQTATQSIGKTNNDYIKNLVSNYYNNYVPTVKQVAPSAAAMGAGFSLLGSLSNAVNGDTQNISENNNSTPKKQNPARSIMDRMVGVEQGQPLAESEIKNFHNAMNGELSRIRAIPESQRTPEDNLLLNVYKNASGALDGGRADEAVTLWRNNLNQLSPDVKKPLISRIYNKLKNIGKPQQQYTYNDQRENLPLPSDTTEPTPYQHDAIIRDIAKGQEYNNLLSDGKTPPSPPSGPRPTVQTAVSDIANELTRLRLIPETKRTPQDNADIATYSNAVNLFGQNKFKEGLATLPQDMPFDMGEGTPSVTLGDILKDADKPQAQPTSANKVTIKTEAKGVNPAAMATTAVNNNRPYVAPDALVEPIQDVAERQSGLINDMMSNYDDELVNILPPQAAAGVREMRKTLLDNPLAKFAMSPEQEQAVDTYVRTKKAIEAHNAAVMQNRAEQAQATEGTLNLQAQIGQAINDTQSPAQTETPVVPAVVDTAPEEVIQPTATDGTTMPTDMTAGSIDDLSPEDKAALDAEAKDNPLVISGKTNQPIATSDSTHPKVPQQPNIGVGYKWTTTNGDTGEVMGVQTKGNGNTTQPMYQIQITSPDNKSATKMLASADDIKSMSKEVPTVDAPSTPTEAATENNSPKEEVVDDEESDAYIEKEDKLRKLMGESEFNKWQKNESDLLTKEAREDGYKLVSPQAIKSSMQQWNNERVANIEIGDPVYDYNSLSFLVHDKNNNKYAVTVHGRALGIYNKHDKYPTHYNDLTLDEVSKVAKEHIDRATKIGTWVIPSSRINSKIDELYSATPVTDKPQGKSLSSEKNKVTPAVKKSDKASNKVPAKSFKNKQELIDFVKHQTNYELPNEDSTLNRNRNRLYTKIDRLHHNSVLSTLNYWGIKYNEHLGGYYWIDLKNGDKAPATNKENAVKPAKQTAIAKGTPATDKFINHTADLISNRQTGKPIGKDEEFSDMYLAARDENKGNTDMLSSLHNIAVKIAAMQNTRAQESSYSLDQSDIAKNIQDIRDMQKGTVSKAKQEKPAKAKNGTTVPAEKENYPVGYEWTERSGAKGKVLEVKTVKHPNGSSNKKYSVQLDNNGSKINLEENESGLNARTGNDNRNLISEQKYKNGFKYNDGIEHEIVGFKDGKYYVRTIDKTGDTVTDIIPAKKLEDNVIEADEHKQALEDGVTKEKQFKKETEDKAVAKTEHDRINGFADDMDSMQRTRINKILDKKFNFTDSIVNKDGTVTTTHKVQSRREMMEEAVADKDMTVSRREVKDISAETANRKGKITPPHKVYEYNLVTAKRTVNGIEQPSTSRQITKIEYDYFNYLRDNKLNPAGKTSLVKRNIGKPTQPTGENGTTVEKKDYRLVDKAKTISGISGVPEKEIKKMIVPYEANNAAEARKYANKFLGKILTNKNYGISGVVSISNFRKMISESSLLKSSFPSVHMTAVANVDTLFKKAEFDVTQQDRDNDTNIKLIHYMYTSMLYRNKAYRIKLVVKELKNPNENNSIYAVEALDVEKPTWKQDIADTVNNNSPMVPPQVGAYILDAKNRKINHPNNPVPNVTAADLSASVKGAAVETIRDGVFSLNFTNGNKIIVDTTVDYIPMDSDKVLKDYGHRPTENDMAVGVTQVISGQRFIRLVSGMSGIKTFNHEIFENAFMNMTRTERSILLKDYGSKEVAADRYADFLMKRMGALTKRSTTIFQKTKDFFSNIRAKLFGKKSEDIFRDIENGNILNREITPEDTENYRIVKRPSEMTKEPEQETTKASADLEYVPPAEPPKAAPDESGNVPTPKAQTIWQKFADDHGLDRVVDRSEEKLTLKERINKLANTLEDEIFDKEAPIRRNFGNDVYKPTRHEMDSVKNKFMVLLDKGDYRVGLKGLNQIFDGMSAEQREGLMVYATYKDRLDVANNSDEAMKDIDTIKALIKEERAKLATLRKDVPFDKTDQIELNRAIKGEEKYINQLTDTVDAITKEVKITKGKAPDYEAAIKEMEAKYPDWVKRHKELMDFMNYIRKGYVDAGIWSQETYDSFMKFRPNYMPAHRSFEDVDPNFSESGSFTKMRGFVNIGSPVKTMKGSKRDIINPIDGIIEDTFRMLRMTAQQKTAQAMIDKLNSGDLAEDLMWRTTDTVSRPGHYTFYIWNHGEKEYYATPDKAIYDVLTMVDPLADTATLERILTLPARWLRYGVSHGPRFMLWNPMRDTMTAAVYAGESGINFVPIVDTFIGLLHAASKDEVYQDYMLNGGGTGRAELYGEELKNLLNEIKGKEEKNWIMRFLNKLGEASETTETATRLGAYIKAKKTGMNSADADMVATDITLNFNLVGKFMEWVNKVIPFSMANVNDIAKLKRAHVTQEEYWKDGKRHTRYKFNYKTVARGILYLTLPSLALWYWNNRDEKRREVYQRIPQWQRNNFWWFISPKAEYVFPIPKPFAVGILYGSIPERLADYFVGKENNKHLVLNTMESLFASLSPSYMPLALQTIFELAMNHSMFYGRDIVPEGEKKLSPKYQFSPFTSEIAKGVGGLINVSPRKLDYAFNSFTGDLGKETMTLIDDVLRSETIQKVVGGGNTRAARNWYEYIPVLSNIIMSPRKFQAPVQEWREESDRLKSALADAKHEYEINGPSGLDDKEKILLTYADNVKWLMGLNTKKDGIWAMQREKNAIQLRKDLSSDQKRKAIDKLDARILVFSKTGMLYSSKFNDSIARIADKMKARRKEAQEQNNK